MRCTLSEKATALMIAVLLAITSSVAWAAEGSQRRTFQIDAQPLETALPVFAKQADLQIVFTPDSVAGLACEAIVGTLPVFGVLERLLQGTGLRYEIIDGNTVAVSQAKTPTTATHDAGNIRLAQAGLAIDRKAASGDAGSPQAFSLEEVVVTAQKREERLQDVPVAITAIGGAQLDQFGAVNTLNLNALAPNLLVRQGTSGIGSAYVSIRGSRSGSATDLGVDGSIGIYLNGVYLGKSASNTLALSDIERVEVLRGPQGTLFGRNTEGGAINYITRKPTGVLEGSVAVEGGNFDYRGTSVYINLPVLGIVSFSLAARTQRSDGWAKNLTGPDLGATDTDIAHAAARFDFSDNFIANYDFIYSNMTGTPNVQSIYALSGWSGSFPSVFGPALGGAIQSAFTPYVTTSRPDTVSSTGLNQYYNKQALHAFTLSYEIGDRDLLKYIGAYRQYNGKHSGNHV